VENCLFRVPRHTLESQSKIFRDMFSLPAVEAEGSSDDNPIRLDGVKKVDFKCLLEVLFTTNSFGLSWRSYEAWLSTVKLSHMWQFDEIYKVAIWGMSYKSVGKSAVEKVALAFQYDIKPWLLPGLNELAQRDEPIGLKDVELLGLDVALKVAAVRESLAWQPSEKTDLSPYRPSFISPSSPHLTSGVRVAQVVDFTPTIKRIFHIPGM
ncbi:hypothetical protein BU15DRAFT_43324, partial [Melanogaster broomeanus]